jgi:hypothetical protein
MLRGCLEAGVAEATLAKASVGAAALAEAAVADDRGSSGLGWQRPWWPITPSSAGEANWVVRTWKGNRDDPRNQPLD